jgi:creatinine amidohydrolase
MKADQVPKVQFEEMFPWEVSRAIAHAPICYLPLGVLEWHGEHNAVGLDAIKAHGICIEAAKQSGGLVVPALFWGSDSREDLPDGRYLTGGIELGERYHAPGSMFWIRPETFRNLLLDIYETVRRRGFKVIIVMLGHWSEDVYVPTVLATGKEFLALRPEMRWVGVTDREVVPDMHYPHEHAAGGETSLLMAIRPDLVDLSKTFETDRSLVSYYSNEREHLARRRETASKYIGVLRGEDGESNDPELTASAHRGRALLDAIASQIAEMARRQLVQGSKSKS